MEVQTVPVHQEFHNACFLGNRWQMSAMQKHRVQTFVLIAEFHPHPGANIDWDDAACETHHSS
jgi:hypothetical protein